jgi:hypothetical protein
MDFCLRQQSENIFAKTIEARTLVLNKHALCNAGEIIRDAKLAFPGEASRGATKGKARGRKMHAQLLISNKQIN